MVPSAFVRQFAVNQQIGLDVADQEVVLHYVLALLNEVGLVGFQPGGGGPGPLLFKGGTALRKCIFGSTGRFSQDIDLDATHENGFETAVEAAFQPARPYHGITFELPSFRYSADGNFSGTIGYRHANAEGSFELQISYRLDPILEPRELALQEQPYFRKAEEECGVPRLFGLDPYEMIGEKVMACSRRQGGSSKDVYDLDLWPGAPSTSGWCVAWRCSRHGPTAADSRATTRRSCCVGSGPRAFAGAISKAWYRGASRTIPSRSARGCEPASPSSRARATTSERCSRIRWHIASIVCSMPCEARPGRLRRGFSVLQRAESPRLAAVCRRPFALLPLLGAPRAAAGTREEEVEGEIASHLAAGEIVLCDRYVESSLVLQRLDDVEIEFILAINSGIRRPDMRIRLRAEPEAIRQRLALRPSDPRRRFERSAGAERELELYEEADRLLQARYGLAAQVYDTTRSNADALGAEVADAIQERRDSTND